MRLLAPKLMTDQFEAAMGRGVYTSRSWQKALNFAVPHKLPESTLFSQVVLLVGIPGQSAVGGPSMWYHQPKNRWLEHENNWVKLDKGWHLTKEDIKKGEATDEQLRAMLRDKLKSKCSRTHARAQGSGEVAWSNRNADFSEEQSGHVHVIGFVLGYVDSSCIKHTRGKRHQIGLVGWDENLLPPYAKPTDWESSDPRRGRVHHASGATQHNWIGDGARRFRNHERLIALTDHEQETNLQSTSS